MTAPHPFLLTGLPPGGAGAAGVRGPADLAHLLSTLECGDDLIVVSNRAPRSHAYGTEGIVASRPAGGLVTAMEALLSAAGGTWIARGEGGADRATVDDTGHVMERYLRAPYRLRRLWLSDADASGYYDGLANEALWPLCHRAGVAPVYRSRDWACYQRVNQCFADAVVDAACGAAPVVLVQDYHLALVPRMVRERLPGAVIVTFWHIPFPAPAALARFPWHAQLLSGLAASTVVGLQTPGDLRHFLAACARTATPLAGSAGAYPISIPWLEARTGERAAARAALHARFGVPLSGRLLLGIDRMDYTKGIVERLLAFERLLERHPALAGQVTLLQVAAPCRSALPAYRQLARRVRALAQRINARFRTDGRVPVVLHEAGIDADGVMECCRACDVCLVTSLHDGMNLVAKEFVAACADLRGVLVLGRDAGAAGELREALVVEPRNTDALADTIGRALAMAPPERARRMLAMRAVVREHTVFRWAAHLIEDGMRGAATLPAAA